MNRSALVITGLFCVTLAGCDSSNGAAARGQIWAVGSSTVYPFAKAVSEQFAQKHANFKSPRIESLGTGGGFKVFCGGVGANYPDIADASRRIKRSEYDMCKKNGAGKMVEIQVGLDGIAFAESLKGAKIPLTALDVYKALAATPFGKAQTAKTWKDVNPALPAEPIKVYGPPSTSGTRDAFAELIMMRGCDVDSAMRDLGDTKADQHRKICMTIREDGAYVDSGENDNLIVQKIEADPKAIGIFGYSFMEENKDRLLANTVNGVSPTYQTISDFTYPGARPLFLYIKSAHVKAVPGIKEYVSEFLAAAGPDGYLKKQGLVLSPAKVQAQSAAIAKDMKALDPSTLP